MTVFINPYMTSLGLLLFDKEYATEEDFKNKLNPVWIVGKSITFDLSLPSDRIKYAYMKIHPEVQKRNIHIYAKI